MVGITPVILGGGTGTRLWPASRLCHPKQFIALTGEGSLLQQALQRFEGEVGFCQPVVVASDEHRFLVGAQAQACKVKLQGLLVEPEARGTAAAIAVAAEWLASRDPASLMLVMPTDHVVASPRKLTEAVGRALPAAEAGWLVAFGVAATEPATDCGCIERGEKQVTEGIWEVRSFLEKASQEAVLRNLAEGLHYWSSGLLLCRASALLSELKRYAPRVHHAALTAVQQSKSDVDFVRLAAAPFAGAPHISIDGGLLQHSQRLAVSPLDDIKWSDVDTWEALYQTVEHDQQGNAIIGEALLTDTARTLAFLPDGRLLAALGVEDLVIVSTADAVLVADRHRAQEVGAIVERLSSQRPDLVAQNRRMHRPWGFYETLHLGDRHHVKRIVVKPKGCLSLQRHYHRCEHWVVVKGTARVTRYDEIHEVTEDGSIYLPLGACHRLENPGRIPLELIEVQTGSYLGEDDIERFDDVYGRSAPVPGPARPPLPARVVNGMK